MPLRLKIPDGPKALALARWAAEKGVAVELTLLPRPPEPVYPPGYPRICRNFHELAGPQDECRVNGKGHMSCRFCRREASARGERRRRAERAEGKR